MFNLPHTKELVFFNSALNISWIIFISSLYLHHKLIGGWTGTKKKKGSCLAVLKLLLFPCELEEKGGSCIVQMEIQLQLAKWGTASGTPMSSRGSLSPLPLQRVIASTQQPCFDRAVLWCQHRAPLGSWRCCSWGFLKQLLSVEGPLGHGQARGTASLRPWVGRLARCSCKSFGLLPDTCRNRCGICWFCQTRTKHLFPSGVSHQYSCWLWKTCKGFHP